MFVMDGGLSTFCPHSAHSTLCLSIYGLYILLFLHFIFIPIEEKGGGSCGGNSASSLKKTQFKHICMYVYTKLIR